MLEINRDDDHVVGADVVRDEAEIAVRRDERQDLLVLPSEKEGKRGKGGEKKGEEQSTEKRKKN